MKLQKILLLGLMIITLITSCDKEEYNQISLIPIEEQNKIDDKAVEKYLADHYFDEKGKVTEFSETSTEDDKMTPLKELAQKDKLGFWYVKRPGVVAEGAKPMNNKQDKILLQYELQTFHASENKEGKVLFTPVTLLSTINTTGVPQEPVFYYGEGQQYPSKYYEIEGFIEGIKHFNATNRKSGDLPAVNFQGLIIMPSRLAFGRNASQIIQGYDNCVVVNFELYQVEKREVKK